MGSGYSFTCPHCNGRNYLTLGIGFDHSPENVFYGDKAPESAKNDKRWTIHYGIHPDSAPLIKKLVSRREYRKVKKLLANGWCPEEFNFNDYGYSLYYCEKCKTLETRFSFRLVKGDEIYSPTFVCDECGTVLKSIEGEWKKSIKDELEKSSESDEGTDWEDLINRRRENLYPQSLGILYLRCEYCHELIEAPCNFSSISSMCLWD